MHRIPLGCNYPTEMDKFRFRIEILFLMMEDYYHHWPNEDFEFSEKEKEEFIKRVTRLQLGWEIVKLAVDRNLIVPKRDQTMELNQVQCIEGLFWELEDHEYTITHMGMTYEHLAPFWETLWEIYDYVFPGPMGTVAKRR